MGQNGHVIREAAGVHDLSAKVLGAKKLSDFKSFEKHLKMIGEAEDFTTIVQNIRADGRDDISRKMAELYVGCLAIHCGTDVVLDDPISPKGDNPDVMLNYEGQRWALPLKTLVGRSGQTIFENIARAARQIDASSAEKGAVVINAKNVIDHDKLWKPSKPFANVDEAIEALRAELRGLMDLAMKDRPRSDWDKVFSTKAVPPIIFMGQSVAYLPVGGAFQAPTPLKAMIAFEVGREDEVASRLASCLNHWMQVLLHG
jgi:hypothetical protein